MAHITTTRKNRGCEILPNLPGSIRDSTACSSSSMYRNVQKTTNKTRINDQLPDPPDWIKDSTSRPPRMFRKDKLLGTGGFAKVFLVESEGGTKFADKVINKTMFAKKNNARLKVTREIAIHKRMSHENIVKFCSFFEDQDHIHILLELCPRKTLLHVSKDVKQVPEGEVRSFTRQILEGVRYIHDQEVLHRDLKLGNMFLYTNTIVKIGDFGLATTFKENQPGNLCGTPNYIAPEVLDKKGHSVSSEVWAIGCMVFALLAGAPPFETASVTSTYALIKVGDYTLPTSLSQEARDFVQVMLVMDPEERGHIRPGLPFNSRSPSLTSHQFMSDVAISNLSSPSMSKVTPVCKMTRKAVHSNVSCHKRMKDLGPLEKLPMTGFLDQVVQGIISCLARPVEEERLAFGISPTFVSKWADYTNKFGFGYKLTDGSVGVRFNDCTKISTTVDKSVVEFTDQRGKVFHFTQKEANQVRELKVRMNNFGYFERYMEEKLSESFVVRESPCPPCSASGQLTKVPQLVRWSRSNDCVSMELSGGLVQVNHLVDHVKLVLWVDQGKMLVSHVEQYKMQTCHLAGPCPSFLRSRLSGVLQELIRLTKVPVS